MCRMNLRKRLVVPPGRRAQLDKRDPAAVPKGLDKEKAQAIVQSNAAEIARLQARLYAEDRRSLLLILQGMDASGKDGAIRKAMAGINPLGCTVVPFKAPTPDELDHDFLWRIHREVPRRGEIGIFNRSHYEDVVVVRVKALVPEPVWSLRYRQINDFERMLVETGTTILKFFLHVSFEEQARQLAERLDEPEKQWKLNEGDFLDRLRWPEYMDAYEDALTKCSTRYAPWYVVPADNRYVRDVAVSEILLATLRAMDPRAPESGADIPHLRALLRRKPGALPRSKPGALPRRNKG